MTSTVLYALGQDGGPVSTADQKVDSPSTPTCTRGPPRPPSASPPRPPWPPRWHPPRGHGSTSPWSRVGDHPVRRHLHTAAGQRAARPEPGSRLVGRRANPKGATEVALGRHQGGRGDRRPRRPLALAAHPQHRLRRPRSRLGVGRLRGPRRRGAGGGRRHAGPRPGRPFGHHAPQGRGRPAGRRVHDGGGTAGRGQLPALGGRPPDRRQHRRARGS